MPSIRTLPPLLVNQIAAGEVIERPASVVKELLENAIDAGATRIDVEIEDGGRELIRIVDDGIGIAPDDLLLAIAPHATSKITCAEDLDRIATMGFRGEALASIASVSRLTIQSRRTRDESGAVVEVEGGDVGGVRPSGCPVGTAVAVRNLFFNTPARRKFLRTAPTEASRIAEMVETLALAHPHISFSLKSNGRMSIEFAAESSHRRRVLTVMGNDLEPMMLEAAIDETHQRGLTLWGMIGLPEIARSNANHQRLYLNGRNIRDRSLQHALKEAYRGLIEPGRYPTLILFIHMDPAMVDVNVHPAKAEVRFRNSAMVHGAVLTAVRSRLREADLTPRFNLSQPHLNPLTSLAASRGPAPEFGSSWRAPFHAGVATAIAPVRSVSEFVDYFRHLDPVQKGFVYSEVKLALGKRDDEDTERLIDGTEAKSADLSVASSLDRSIASALPQVQRASDVMQVHASYVVTQDEEGLLIIDQHALHERVMFENLLARLGSGALESQRLLMPVVLEVDRREIDLLPDLQPLFARIGLEVEPMGPREIAVQAFPSFLFERGVEVEPFVRDLLTRALAEGFGANVEAAVHEVLDMMACKAAVKAGDHLSDEELRELLAHRGRIERSSNCPHGRPTTLRLTIAELDKQFGRT